MDLIARLLRTPVLSRLVSTWVIAVCAVQQYLGPRAAVLEAWRHLWWRRLHVVVSRVDGYAIDRSTAEEYVCSVDGPLPELERRLWRQGYHRNLLAAMKYRHTSDGVEWSASSWVSRERFRADHQCHVTLFGRSSGGVDCYVHREPSPVTRPLDHWLVHEKTVGDPDGTYRDSLDAADVEWFRDGELSPPDDRSVTVTAEVDHPTSEHSTATASAGRR